MPKDKPGAGRPGDDHFDDREVDEILGRAAELEQRASLVEEFQTDRQTLVESAEEVGLDRAFVEQAVQEKEREWRAERAAAIRRRQTLALAVGAAALLLALAGVGGLARRSRHAAASRQAQAQLDQAQLLVDQQAAEYDHVLARRRALLPQLLAAAESVAAGDRAEVAELARLAEQPDRVGDAELARHIREVLAAVGRARGGGEIYVRLSDEIAGTENRITVARKRYAEAVTAYNQQLQAAREAGLDLGDRAPLPLP